MINLIKVGNAPNKAYRTYICDSAADIANLPSNAPVGSQAEIIEDGSIYLINSQGLWIKQNILRR